jgi:hypothetical protein
MSSKQTQIVESILASSRQQLEAMQSDLKTGMQQIEILRKNIAATEGFIAECELALADEKQEAVE